MSSQVALVLITWRICDHHKVHGTVQRLLPVLSLLWQGALRQIIAYYWPPLQPAPRFDSKAKDAASARLAVGSSSTSPDLLVTVSNPSKQEDSSYPQPPTPIVASQ